MPPFADLWFAVRGGGGGTFGVLTALKYQLHEHKPLTLVTIDQAVLARLTASAAGACAACAPCMAVCTNGQIPANGDVAACNACSVCSSQLCGASSTLSQLARLWVAFLVDLLYAPLKLGLDEETSLLCGSPALNFNLRLKCDFRHPTLASFFPDACISRSGPLTVVSAHGGVQPDHLLLR